MTRPDRIKNHTEKTCNEKILLLNKKIEERDNQIASQNKIITDLKTALKDHNEIMASLRHTEIKKDVSADNVHNDGVAQPHNPHRNISRAVFGVYLGESLDDLKKRLFVEKSSYTFTDEDYPAEVWQIENDDAAIKDVQVYTFNRQVFAVIVKFKDASYANFEAIISELKKIII